MAVSNIRKNKKLYVPYIITAIFTVMMFFMNISIVKNKNVAAMRGGQNVVVLLQVALVVSFIFSAVFLFYTNSFLMKRRTKEIGLYNILGMEKKHISLMMLFENVIITIITRKKENFNVKRKIYKMLIFLFEKIFCKSS